MHPSYAHCCNGFCLDQYELHFIAGSQVPVALVCLQCKSTNVPLYMIEVSFIRLFESPNLIPSSYIEMWAHF